MDGHQISPNDGEGRKGKDENVAKAQTDNKD